MTRIKEELDAVDGSHDFIATDHQKNPLEEQIIVIL